MLTDLQHVGKVQWMPDKPQEEAAKIQPDDSRCTSLAYKWQCNNAVEMTMQVQAHSCLKWNSRDCYCCDWNAVLIKETHNQKMFAVSNSLFVVQK